MKYWVSHLPLEVWVDVFCYPWISREKMGSIVHKIGNYKFAEYLQFYLHDWGKRALDHLFLYRGFSRTPIPANIKTFECISIGHFGAQTFSFLRQISPILTNVNLQIHPGISCNWCIQQFCDCAKKNMGIILANLLPLLNGIHSLDCAARALPTIGQCLGDELAKLKVLKIFHREHKRMDQTMRQTTVNFVFKWLTSSPEQEENMPKLYVDAIADIAFCVDIFLEIREQFFVAKTRCTFAVILLNLFWKEFHHENGIGEVLHGQKIEDGKFQIIRHPADRGPELQEWIKESKAKSRQGRITFCAPLYG